jgi:hypothetical protein
MTHRSSPLPVVDLDSLPDDLAADATVFIRISGPPVRRPPHVVPPPPPRARPLPPSPAPAATPFRVQAAPPSPPQSVSSVDPVMLAAVGAVFFLAVVSLVGAVELQHRASGGSSRPELVLEPQGRGASMALAGDTGDWHDDQDDPDDPDEAVDPGLPRVAPDPSVEAAVAETHRPAPTPALAALTVSLPDPGGITRMAVSCNSGFQGLSGYNTQPLVVAGVPTNEPCTVHFRGASPYRYHGARGGQTLSCAFSAGVVTCG